MGIFLGSITGPIVSQVIQWSHRLHKNQYHINLVKRDMDQRISGGNISGIKLNNDNCFTENV